eukprot:s762_g10.t1
MPNLNKVTRKQAQEYFDNSWTMEGNSGAFFFGSEWLTEPFYRPPVHGLRHPQIFYYGHTPCLYINKLRVAGVLKDAVDPYMESIMEAKFECLVSGEEFNAADMKALSRAMVTTETIVPCLENDAHKLGAIVATATAVVSSGTAIYLHHIGMWAEKAFAVKILDRISQSREGCRYHWIQDISCGGIYMPEYAIFGCAVKGIESAMSAHVAVATNSGATSTWPAYLSPGKQRNVLPHVLQWCRISEAMPRLLFHVIWMAIFAWVEAQGEQSAATAFKKQCFHVKTDCQSSLEVSARSNNAGTDVVSAPQDAWHKTMLKKPCKYVMKTSMFWRKPSHRGSCASFATCTRLDKHPRIGLELGSSPTGIS